MSILQKRSFSLERHRTSVALEPEFWIVLEFLAQSRACSMAQLVTSVDVGRAPEQGLASALRLLALRVASSADYKPNH